MKSILMVFLMSIASFVYGQGLSKERIDNIKNSTVQIAINDTVNGTGFFIDLQGQILTCWHVIEPSFIKDSVGNIKSFKKLTVILNSGEKLDIGINKFCFGNGNESAVAYDYCLLKLIKPRTTKYHLNLGDYESLSEGDEIYTCGFPLNLTQPFITKGIVSTKFKDTLNSINVQNNLKRMPRDEAYLDITLNPGNSGGAIVKIGSKPSEDVVVGLADFIVGPIAGKQLNDLVSLFTRGIGKYNLEGIDPNAAFLYFTQILSRLSLGVSGCISTNHFLNALSNIKN